MYSIPANWQQCLTCRHWGGNRKPTNPYYPDFIECDHDQVKGMC